MIGPNGCGKSTMMRLMQQKEKPRAGTAMMGDSAQCKVNYFYQNQAEGLDTERRACCRLWWRRLPTRASTTSRRSSAA